MMSWDNVHIPKSEISSDGMFWKEQVHTTTHRLLGPISGKNNERFKGEREGEINNVFVCWYK